MKLLITLLIFLFLPPSISIAQTQDDFICAPVTEDPYSDYSLTGGKYKPSKNAEGEYLRVLVAFVQFQGDNTSASDWDSGSLPGWAYSFLDQFTSTQYADCTYSDFWNEMAVGDFDVIGDVYPNLIILPSEETYANANPSENFSHTNLDAIEIIDTWAQSEGQGSWNWTPYDNWEYDPGTQTFVFNPGNADGYVDMIFMIYRNATYYDLNDSTDYPGKWFGGGWGAFSGAATLGNIAFEYVTNDDLIISSGNGYISDKGSGITFRNGGPHGKWNTLGLMSHEYGHYLFGGGHTNYSGIMGGWTYAMNGWERLRVDQIEAVSANYNGYQSTLGDFIETGDILKISVPFNNPSSTTYFLVENHQRTSSYDHIVRGGPIGGGWDYTGLGKGIYVYLIKYGNSYPGSQHEMLAADGYFDWDYIGDFWAGPGWYVGKSWEGWLPITTRNAVNRNTGKNDRMPKHIYWNNHWAAKWVDVDINGNYWLSRDVMGDLTDAFNFDYNELITNWSNPSTYVDDLTDISIQLFEENGGEITIKVFSNYSSALALPPSKPQNLAVERSQNYHPYLTWDANQEPDVLGGGHYNIYKFLTETGWLYFSQTANTYFEDYDENYCTLPPKFCTSGRYIRYRVTAVDNSSKESVPSDSVRTYTTSALQEKINITPKNILPAEYSLEQNYPNPFNPSTRIYYSIQKDGIVTLKVYDVLGNEVVTLVNERKSSGYYEVEFNASNFPSGIFFYRIQAGTFTDTKKLILLK